MLLPRKGVILILVVGLKSATYAQRTFDEHEVLFVNISNASIPEVTLTAAERDSLFRQLARDADYCGSEKNAYSRFDIDEFIDEHEQHITFTRLNGDTFIDVVFDGMACLGHESGIVEFFIGTPDGFRKTFFHWGRIVRYRRTTNGHDLWVHKYPCCASYTNSYERLAMSLDRDTVVVIEMRLLASPHTAQGPFFPEKIDLSETIVTIEPVDIRWSPDTVSMELLNNLDNNVVARFGSGVEGTLLYRQEDGPWGFVLMHSAPIDHQLEVKYLPLMPFATYGWVQLSSISAQ